MALDRKGRPASEPSKADPEQYQRFLEAAREAGCDENFAQFEEALKRVVKYRPEKPPRTPAPAQSPAEGPKKRGRPAKKP